MRKIDNQIFEYLKDDTNIEKCRQPQVAFITFEDEESLMIAMHINDEQRKAQTGTFKAGETVEDEWRIMKFGGG